LAITAQNVTYLTSAPVAGGSTTLAFGGSSLLEYSYLGTVTFTGDGTLATATINYIDGTNTLAWTPSACVAVRVGGNAANTIVGYAQDASDKKTATVFFTAAPANGATVQMAILILK
jgi:hypothetical protein